MAETLHFDVQGSDPEPYQVSFAKINDRLLATCTCAAGINGQLCKHRLRIIQGSTEGIVSANSSEAAAVAKWAEGTEVESTMKEIEHAEAALESAKKQVSTLKKKLGRILFASDL